MCCDGRTLVKAGHIGVDSGYLSAWCLIQANMADGSLLRSPHETEVEEQGVDLRPVEVIV